MIQTGTLSKLVTSMPIYCWNCFVPHTCLRSCGACYPTFEFPNEMEKSTRVSDEQILPAAPIPQLVQHGTRPTA